MIKIIAIGNLLMGDDGIALKITDSMKKRVKELDLNIQCIKAETDFNFALDNIDNGDFLFILDGMMLDLECGEIIMMPISHVKNSVTDALSIHSISLFSLIKTVELNVSGFIIGIQVADVDFGLELSHQLQRKFQEICDKVYTIIKEESLQYFKIGENNA